MTRGTAPISEVSTLSSMTLDNRKLTYLVTELQSGIPLPATSQQFAITKWDSWNQALYLSLLQGGSIKGNHWDGKTMNNISSFNFKSGPDTNFTSIAMTPDAMFYGISNSQIVEYSLDTTDPSTFNYVGVVFP